MPRRLFTNQAIAEIDELGRGPKRGLAMPCNGSIQRAFAGTSGAVLRPSALASRKISVTICATFWRQRSLMSDRLAQIR